MSFLNDLGETLSTGGKFVADKAKELSEVANLRAQVISCDNVMNKNFKELGKLYYEQNKESNDSQFAEQISLIKNAEEKKSVLLNQIAELKAKTGDVSDDVVDNSDSVMTETYTEVEAAVTSDAASDDNQ